MKTESKSILIKSINKELIGCEVLKKEPFFAIILILSIGLLYHKYRKGKIAELYITHFPQEKKIKLVYLKTTSDVMFRDVLQLLNEMYIFARENGVGKIETLVVNPFLNHRIMTRNGWKFEKRKWIIGRYYIKNTGNE